MSPYAYINRIFRADAVRQGGIVRRKMADVQRLATFKELKAEVERRGFHLLETGDQYVIVCNAGNFKVHC